ncbi:hypothetical protein FK178_13170 [Antarcticibacterium arcticum]|uniref:Cadherin domain-containing protein n=1 Tax=Antarcticibacterium arcticum TaxID=2585771 RepID=A0A5B8YMV8_9FLAO|nr:hypothetical protein [Antarcticibacterium arcticum]QED38608.1 hypothetical protein FK178_13170 [Antarcticibacterium arcticum]
MKTKIKYVLSSLFALLLLLAGCSKEEYSFGDLEAPSNVAINTEIVGQSADNPNGDGSGLVHISVDADNAIAYKIDFGTSPGVNLVPFNGEITRQFTKTGDNDYRLTVVVYGAGGAATTITKDIRVNSVFNADPELVANLIGEGSKTWVVDKSVPGHFGVGPWDDASTGPEWWSAGVNEKVGSADCFYSTTFTFSQTGTNYTLTVNAPQGAFTKTGSLANNLPGIPAGGDEGCYVEYTGGSSSFSFIPSSTGIPASTPSTKTSIELAGFETYIGYGAVQKEYEILVITENYLYLRVRGTETGNAWYLKLVPAE